MSMALRLSMAAAAVLVIAACGSGDNQGWHGDAQDDPAGEEPVLPPDDGELPPDDVTPPDVPVDYVPTDEVCGEEDFPLTYDVSSDVLIVLDRSGSMMGMLRGVKDAVNAVVSASDDKIWFGLMPFPNSVPPDECRMVAPLSACDAPDMAHVTLGPNRAPDIAAVLTDLAVCGNTPTTDTLRSARAHLASAGTGHTQYVLLATDGLPNCNDTLDGATCDCQDTENGCLENPGACTDDAASYVAIDDLMADGVKTYVLGMGSWAAADQDILNAMAEHGGTGTFYAAETPDSLLAAFEEIMGTVVLSCTFDLLPPEGVDENKVNFYIGEEVIPRDTGHTSGWDYVDGNTVEFYGSWCDTIKSGDVSGVKARFGCPTIVI